MNNWSIKQFSLIIGLLLSFSGIKLNAQEEKAIKHRIKLCTTTPVLYGLGYEVQVGKYLSPQIKFGWLTEPNTSLVLYTLETMGTDPLALQLIENAFQSGWVGEFGLNVAFKKNYFGLFAQYINLKGEETPIDIVAEVAGIEMDETVTQFLVFIPSQRAVTLNSSLFQAGILYGRRIPLGLNVELNVELGISKNFSSWNSIEFTGLQLGNVDALIDGYLDGIYSNYAYVPSLALNLVNQF